MKRKACVFLAEGFEEIEAITVVDILKRAKVDIKTISISETYYVKGAHDVTVKCDNLFTDNISYKDIDLIILPGGMPGTTNLSRHEGLCKLIEDFNDNNKKIAAICAAPSILGKLGILNNKKATCYPGFEDELLGAIVTEDSVVIDTNIITAKGPGAASDFSFKILQSFFGCNIVQLKKSMIY